MLGCGAHNTSSPIILLMICDENIWSSAEKNRSTKEWHPNEKLGLSNDDAES